MIESIFFNPWIWICGVVLAVAAAAVVWGIWFRRTRGEWDGIAGSITATIAGTLFGILGIAYFGMILVPYDASFYNAYRITGEVTQIESAFSGEEGTVSQIFIAEVDGIPEYIKSDDQRFRTVNVGDDVNLVCSKGFAYFQEPWYDCAFGGLK